MKLRDLFEARDPSLTYKTEEVKKQLDRVIVTLEGNRSGVMTKFAKRYKEIDEAAKAIAREREELNDQMKQTVEALFDAEDEYLTRVVETASIAITLSKSYAQKADKTDWEAVANGLMALLTEEMVPEGQKILKWFTTIGELEKVTPKLQAPKFKESISESAMGDFLARIKNATSKAVNSFKSWAGNVDNKIANLKSAADSLLIESVEESGNDSDHNILAKFKDLGNKLPSGYVESNFYKQAERLLGRTGVDILHRLINPSDHLERSTVQGDDRLRSSYYERCKTQNPQALAKVVGSLSILDNIAEQARRKPNQLDKD